MFYKRITIFIIWVAQKYEKDGKETVTFFRLKEYAQMKMELREFVKL